MQLLTQAGDWEVDEKTLLHLAPKTVFFHRRRYELSQY